MMRRGLLPTSVALLVVGASLHLALVDFFLHRVNAGGIVERTQEQYDAVRGTVRTLVLGNSHAKWGIAAAELDDAFNMALGGQTAPETYYVLKSQLDDPAVTLRWIVMPTDALTFSAWQAGVFGYRHWYAHRVDYLAIGILRGQPLRYGVNGLLGRYAPYVGRRSEILQHLTSDRPPGLSTHVDQEMVCGSFLASGSWANVPAPERQEEARKRAKMHFPSPDFDEVAGTYFRRTLELARDAGVRVLAVRFPASREYLLASRPFNESARVEQRLAEILADHPEVQVLDARLDYVGRPRLFIDPDHLSGRGARLLTRRIRQLLAGETG